MNESLMALKKDIFQAEQDGILAVLESSDTDILTDDFEEDRLIRYHMIPVTKEWLKSLFFWGLGTEDLHRIYEDYLTDLLLKVDPNMFITLRKIIFAGSEQDISDVCDILEADEDEWPSAVEFDELDCIGCHWWHESAVIINVPAIDKAVDEAEKEYEGLYFNKDRELRIGIATTLLHEIRHLGLSNPFLDEEEYPSSEGSEERVEAWALNQFEEK